MENATPLHSAPMPANVTVGRDYLTEREIERLMKAAGDNRYGHRNATAILVGAECRLLDLLTPQLVRLPALAERLCFLSALRHLAPAPAYGC
jgi:hypothetical protein